MGVAPELWVKAETVRGESVGVGLLPEQANDSSSCQRLCVERDCARQGLWDSERRGTIPQKIAPKDLGCGLELHL